MMLVAVAGWVNREQLAIIDYLTDKRHERSIELWNRTGPGVSRS
jgi:hypothetical protein